MEVSVQTVDCRIPTGMEIYINEMKNNGGVCVVCTVQTVDCRIPTGMKIYINEMKNNGGVCVDCRLYNTNWNGDLYK